MRLRFAAKRDVMPSAPVPITPSAGGQVAASVAAASTSIAGSSTELEAHSDYSRTPTSSAWPQPAPHLSSLDGSPGNVATTSTPGATAPRVLDRPWIVQKYGGTSVGKFLPTIAGTIAPEFLRRNRLAIVCSARSTGTKAAGTTSLLLAAAEQALSSEEDTSEGSLSNSVASLSSTRDGRASLSRNASRVGVRTPTDLQDVTAPLHSSSLGSSPPPPATQSASDRTVDRIMGEHIDAARSLVTKDPVALRQLEEDIREDCERLRDLLLAAKVSHCSI